MKSNPRRTLVLGLALSAQLLPAFGGFALSFFCSCARRETDAEAGVRTHTLLVGNTAEPEGLDPQLAAVNRNILEALFEGLTAIDPKTSRPVPAAAERWDVSADGLVYTFHLRADARWSNGDPVTAQDFAYSSRDYDALIVAAAQTLEEGRRYELFQQAESLLLEEAPIAPIYFSNFTYLVHPAVKNWEPSPIGNHRLQFVELTP